MGALEERTLPIAFTARQIIFLFDAVRVEDLDLGDPDNPGKIDPIGRGLLIKLGSAFLEMTTDVAIEDKKACTLEFTEKECWLIKARVRSGDMSASVPVGIPILRRVMETLISFRADLGNVPIACVEDDHPFTQDDLQLLQLKEKEDAGAKSSGTNADYGPYPNTKSGKGKTDPS